MRRMTAWFDLKVSAAFVSPWQAPVSNQFPFQRRNIHALPVATRGALTEINMCKLLDKTGVLAVAL